MRVTKPPARHRPPDRPTGKMPVPGPHGPQPPGVEPSPSTSAAREETLSQLPGAQLRPRRRRGHSTISRNHDSTQRPPWALQGPRSASKAGRPPAGAGPGAGGTGHGSTAGPPGGQVLGRAHCGGATLARGAVFHAACSVLHRGLLPPATGRQLRPGGPGLVAWSHTCGLLELRGVAQHAASPPPDGPPESSGRGAPSHVTCWHQPPSVRGEPAV